MAKFCTSCGSPLSDDMKFCLKCGTPTGAPEARAVSSAAPPPAPSVPPPPVPQAAPAASAPGAGATGAPVTKSGGLLKIVLIVLAVVVLISALGIGSCIYVAYRAKQKYSTMIDRAKSMSGGLSGSSTGSPEVRVEEGGPGSEAAAAATADVPVYPGATATEAGGNMSLGGLGISGQEFVTSDSVDQVIEFYKDKLGSKARFTQSGNNAVFTMMSGKSMTTITVTREEGAEVTKINISRIGK